MTLHAADIAHHGFGRHGAVSDDLRDTLGAVFGGDVLNDPVAPRHAEVDVEVGHRDALRIQKALEQQVIAQRIYIHNAQGIGHERTRAGAAPGPHGHTVVARPVDEIGDDQKVTGKTHRTDHGQFGIQALPIDGRVERRRSSGQLRVQPAHRGSAQVGVGCGIGGHRKHRQARLAQAQHETATPRDLDAIGQHGAGFREQRRHLRGAAQKLLRRVAAGAGRISQQRTIVNADARLVRFEVTGQQEAHLVGRHTGHAVLAGQCQCGGHISLFAGGTNALHLDVKTIAKQRHPGLERLAGLRATRLQQRATDVTGLRTRECDQTTGRGRRQPAALDEWFTVHLALEPAARHQAREIPVTFEVLTQ